MVSGIVIPLDGSNIDITLASYEVVFVNFYADWCRFSQQLKPIFMEASEKFKDFPPGKVAWASVDSDRQGEIAQKYHDFPPGKVAWASVDSDRQGEIAQKYHVNKYPTLKLFRNGELVKKEYRGQRSVEALSSFVQAQLDNKLIRISSDAEFTSRVEKGGRNVVAYFSSESGPEFDNFKRVASVLRDDCVFWIGVGDGFSAQMQGSNKLFFYPANTDERFEYSGGLANYDYLKQWLVDKCIPLVRELTFENAEELTEEGLPFLILFRSMQDSESAKIFTEQVIRELPDQKSTINCLIADGKKFAHPLHHLGKTEKDLPVLAIDSFRHMYLFPDMSQLTVPGKLRQFVLDLHSGKLHREFHHGPDPTEQVPTSDAQKQNVVGDTDLTQPPPSIFRQLKPSETRYSLLNKDEL
ncbi:Thioredoxin domain-containing protein C06A6.5 [Toxocara canis]|uniref:Thioredoxin domain-containing protein C06A6.5 n=1 Tax=Toxocara canis TaxID=6265 RepID=A0A0B2URC6_TOXCA|nr:Thioredoxin domain-containing protein C06A6.5 [Toxocara canis]